MKEKEALKPAELFFKKMRMRFFSLYPSEFSAQLRIFLSCYEAKWEKGHVVEPNHTDYNASENQLTECGYDSLRNANQERIPMMWPDVHATHSVLACIPDDAEDSWLESISMMCYRIEKIELSNYIRLAKAHWDMSPMAPEYRKQHLDRTIANFKEAKEFLVKHQVRERVWFIKGERCKPKGYVPPLQVKKGAVVRLKTGVATAIVQSDNLTFGNDTVKGACYLNKPLNGTRYWNKADLIAISNS